MEDERPGKIYDLYGDYNVPEEQIEDFINILREDKLMTKEFKLYILRKLQDNESAEQQSQGIRDNKSVDYFKETDSDLPEWSKYD